MKVYFEFFTVFESLFSHNVYYVPSENTPKFIENLLKFVMKEIIHFYSKYSSCSSNDNTIQLVWFFYALVTILENFSSLRPNKISANKQNNNILVF